DTAAFEALFRRYEGTVERIVAHVGGSPEAVEDLCQETFLRIHRNLRSFRFGSSVKTWICRVAVNVAIDFARQFKARPVAEAEPDWDRVPSDALSPEDQAARAELQALVQQRIAELNPKLRATLVLREIHGMTYSEIASVMGCRVRSVETRLRRARQQLMARLGTGWLRGNE
ncbi:MAG: sigma-70 family RNA polymerase sigma factor, partial [Planctomycetes bacterium]|nr:sigma-70 family RNA polymerase sigma factor [Planctomycetota bacterium]